MTRYGKNFVLIRTGNGQTRNEIIEAYNEYTQHTRQLNQEIRDREFLNTIPDNEFQAVVRQYTGHNIIPARVRHDGHLYDIVWISEVVRW